VRTGSLDVLFHTAGTPPNTASRIEDLNKDLSTTLLAPASLVRDLTSVVARRLGFFPLRSVSSPVEIVELIGVRGAVSESDHQLCERFAVALDTFENGDYSRAAVLFQQLVSSHDDGPARYYYAEAKRKEGEVVASLRL
jgi:TolA-binding protein